MRTPIGPTRGAGLLAVLALLIVVMTAPTPSRASTPRVAIVDLPVAFTVENVNRSGVPCSTDGRTYTVRGHVTGPANLVHSRQAPGVTVYVHGLELGEWFWRLPVPGYNHAWQMAELGHVSLTIDRLGYNASDHPAGTGSCIGGQADILHQIVGQLRRGTYFGEHRRNFPRVALAGHSLGGSIAQIEAYSFDDIEALAVLSYADMGVSASGLAKTTSWLPKCLTGGDRSTSGQRGYAHLTRDAEDFRANFLAHANGEVKDSATPRWDLNPCGDLTSIAQAVTISTLRLREISDPVLVLSGSEDKVFTPEGVRRHRAMFTGSNDVTMQLVDGASHGLTFDREADRARRTLSAWLRQRGF